MKTYILNKHSGAVAWAKSKGFCNVQSLSLKNFGLLTVAPGDVVIGELTILGAEKVCNQGGEYYHLSLSPSANPGSDFGNSVQEFRRIHVGNELSGEIEDWYEQLGESAFSEKVSDRTVIKAVLTQQGLMLKLHAQGQEPDIDAYVEYIADYPSSTDGPGGAWRINFSEDLGDIFGQVIVQNKHIETILD